MTWQRIYHSVSSVGGRGRRALVRSSPAAGSFLSLRFPPGCLKPLCWCSLCPLKSTVEGHKARRWGVVTGWNEVTCQHVLILNSSDIEARCDLKRRTRVLFPVRRPDRPMSTEFHNNTFHHSDTDHKTNLVALIWTTQLATLVLIIANVWWAKINTPLLLPGLASPWQQRFPQV